MFWGVFNTSTAQWMQKVEQQQLASSNRKCIIKLTPATQSKESGTVPFDLILKFSSINLTLRSYYTTTILSLIDSISDTISKDILENFSNKLESISTTTYTFISLSAISQEESEGLYPVCTVIISINSGYNLVFDNLDNTSYILFLFPEFFQILSHFFKKTSVACIIEQKF